MKVKPLRKAKAPYLDAELLRLMRLVEARQYADVERVSRGFLERFPQHPLAMRALTFALVGLRQFEAVILVADLALRNIPNDGEVRNNRAIALSELMRWDEAIVEFDSALRLLPGDFEIHKNLGVAYFRLHRWTEAIAGLLKAIELHPGDYVEAIEYLSRALIYSRRFDEAALVCQSLYEASPDDLAALNRVINVALHRCDWNAIDEKLSQLAPWFGSATCVANPWELYKYWRMSMADYRKVAERFSTSKILANVRDRKAILPMTWRPAARKLRVGYLSSDLGEHPVGYVIAELIERHDRDKFEVFAYALGGNDGSEQCARLLDGFDHFVDLSGLSVPTTTERIRADEIDILVDLNGWTGKCRPESLALGCAPVQISWLGYAGTMGSPCFADYVLGDAEVTPMDHQPWFAECIVQLPYSYMPADSRQVVSPAPTRNSQGLPDEAFVMCSFNNNYKINPLLFDLWCDLLRCLPNAVLWLLKGNETAEKNLLYEAQRRGVAPSQLVFAGRVKSRRDYLARLQLADIALDTFPYNSHSTGVDALVAGVPMVTKRGDAFPGRVGASLMIAAGLPELVADDNASYRQLVIDLCGDRNRLAALSQYLVASRVGERKSPLFDMARFSVDLEKVYVSMARKAANLSEAI